jgi:Uma2 family endonuclease
VSETAVRTEDALITGEALARMPGLGPCELIDGRIVPTPPTGGEHGWVEGKAYKTVEAFVDRHRLGQVLVGEVGISTRRNPDRVRRADVAFVSAERRPGWSRPAGFLDVAPDLVVEVLSPNDTVMDLTEKLPEYFAIGVRLVWVIDPRARRVHACRSPTDVREFGATERLPGDDVLPGFEVPVATLFE